MAMAVGLFSTAAHALSPPNLHTDIPWHDSGMANGSGKNRYLTVQDIRQAYNRARVEEEKQFGLASGALGTLELPGQTVWDAMADDAKALYLINAERTARAEMLPGVLGLPLQGVGQAVDAVSEAYSRVLVERNAMGHSVDGTDPWQRLDRAYPNGCREFTTRAENLFFAASYSTAPSAKAQPMPVERSIYLWIYADAGSQWGHRETVLLQDAPLNAPRSQHGFKNNTGDAESEGLLGFYRLESPQYDPFQSTQWPYKHGTVVTMNIMDPAPGDCQFTLTYTHDQLPVPVIEP